MTQGLVVVLRFASGTRVDLVHGMSEREAIADFAGRCLATSSPPDLPLPGWSRVPIYGLNRTYGARPERTTLAAIGVPENALNVNNKISRGGFTAVFFLQCMEALGVKNLQLDSGD